MRRFTQMLREDQEKLEEDMLVKAILAEDDDD